MSKLTSQRSSVVSVHFVQNTVAVVITCSRLCVQLLMVKTDAASFLG